MSPTTPRSAAGSGPLTRLTGAWQAASPRERKLLVAAAAVVGVALVVSALDWSREQRTRLGRSLPRAEAQLEQVQESATEITRLRAQPVPRRPAGPPGAPRPPRPRAPSPAGWNPAARTTPDWWPSAR